MGDLVVMRGAGAPVQHPLAGLDLNDRPLVVVDVRALRLRGRGNGGRAGRGERDRGHRCGRDVALGLRGRSFGMDLHGLGLPGPDLHPRAHFDMKRTGCGGATACVATAVRERLPDRPKHRVRPGGTVDRVLERLEIESFLILADELHFGRTAERLHVSRARVSQTIRSLERRIGAPLFERTSRTVRLTPLGRRLHEEVKPGYRRVEQGVARAQAEARGFAGVLPVGYLGSATGEFVMDVARAFGRIHPDTEVQIHETQLSDLLGPLRTGRVDVLVTHFPVAEPDLTRGPVVLRVPRMLAVPANHTLAKRQSVSLEDLARDRVFACSGDVPDYWQEHLAPPRTPSGQPVRRGRSAATMQETLAMVGAGQGISPVGADVAAHYTPRGVVYVPFSDAEPVEYGLVWRTAGETARVRAFVEAAAELGTDGRKADGPKITGQEPHAPNTPDPVPAPNR
ncbi:LysR family transcriptional regulator [Streptomyces sp. NPDC014646]|uniref:LysR family transcriptional regulator n=1 Tax=Streptomyces sp. NPDC014646 TaxID=3364877 RepID=UPI0036FFEC18